MKILSLLLSNVQSNAEESSQAGGTAERLLAIFRNPVFYIVVGIFLVLVLVVYLLTRITRPRHGFVVIVVRKGKIRKILDENEVYYRIPFLDSIGAEISSNKIDFTSDRLFINNGPDCLYRFSYTLGYKIINPKLCYEHFSNLQETIEKRINDSLRLFVDNGNAYKLITDYRSSEKSILDVVNNAINDLGVEAISFKVNYIEPLGK